MQKDYRVLLQLYCDKTRYSSLKLCKELKKRGISLKTKEVQSWIWDMEVHCGKAYNDVLDIIGAQSILIHKDSYIKNGVIYNGDGTPLKEQLGAMKQPELKSSDPKDVREYLEERGFSVQERIDFYLDLSRL